MIKWYVFAEANGAKHTNSLEENSFPCQMNQSIKISQRKRYYLWLRIAVYATLALLGQSATTLLGRLYYENGGKSKWMATLVQVAGFPILLPYYHISAPKDLTENSFYHQNQPSKLVLTLVYVSLGQLVTLNCYLNSAGLWFLPVSTYSLICSSQLAFNAIFSYFLNSLKITPYIINSLVLLTISSALLVFQDESPDSTQISNKKYVIGFIFTVAASAGVGLGLSLTQFAFKNVIKRENFKVIIDMIVYLSLVATCASLVGLFASGEWKGLKKEIEGYETGKAAYILNLAFTAIISQLVTLGCTGLVFEVSSLFSNAISVLGQHIVPILAVMVFQDKMHGIKVISMVLAVWGFISYVYQQYLDECKSQTEDRSRIHHVPKTCSHLEKRVVDELSRL